MKPIFDLSAEQFRKYLLKYKENIPAYISILSQVIDVSAKEAANESFVLKLRKELSKAERHQTQLQDMDNLMIQHSLGIDPFLGDNLLISSGLIEYLSEVSGAKPDWNATAQRLKIKLENFVSENQSQISAVMIGSAASFLFSYLLKSVPQEDLVLAPVQLSSDQSVALSSPNTELFSINPLAIFAGALGNFLNNSASLNQMLGSLMLATAMRSGTVTFVSYLSLMGLKMVALDVEAAGRDKIVYCGPNVDCDHLIQTAYASRFELQQFDRQQKLSGSKYGVETLIINAHADHVMLHLYDKKFDKPDNFVAGHFPLAKIIHVVGCSVGGNVERDFSFNSLKPGQIMFIHSGSNNVADMNTMSHLISGAKAPFFPSPIPTRIIIKQDATSSKIVKIEPPSFNEIQKIIDTKGEDREQKLFELFNGYFLKNKARIKAELGVGAAQEQVEFELEKIGFVDYSGVTKVQKQDLVRNYLSSTLISFEINSDQKVAFIESGLVNVNYRLGSGVTPLTMASKEGDTKVVSALLSRAEIDPNQVNEKGATALFVATERGDEKVVDLLMRHEKTNPDIAINAGETPLSIAASLGKKEIFKKLLVKTKDPNIPRDDGVTPLCILIQTGREDLLDELLKHKNIDPNRAVEGVVSPLMLAISNKRFDAVLKLIARGADPDRMLKTKAGVETNSYKVLQKFFAKDSGFVREFEGKMKAAREEFNKQNECPSHGVHVHDAKPARGEGNVQNI